MRRVHGEATECIVFIGRAWTEQAMETMPGVPHNGGNEPPTFGTRSEEHTSELQSQN